MPFRDATALRRLAQLVAAAGIAATPSFVWAQVPAPQSGRWGGACGQAGDFEVVADTTIAHTGRTSIRVTADDDPSGFANVCTALPAPAYVGHRIRLSAYLRTANLGGGGAALWARADDANHQSVAFLNTQATPARGTNDWKQVSLSLDIPSGAAQLYIGVLSLGPGSLWIDDARVEADSAVAPVDFGFERPADFVAAAAVPRAVTIREPPRALTPRGLANLTAFTTALGLVRFFHPSIEAVRANWDAIAVHGVRAVESAPTPDSLASALRGVFGPVAPGVSFARSGAPTATPPKPLNATHVVFWRHEGVGVPTGGFATPAARQSVYRSERVVVPIAAVGQPVPLRDVRLGGSIVSRPRVPDPSRPLVVALDGGVTIVVPIALYTTDTIVPDSLKTPRALAVNERFTANDRATRLADVARAWSLFEHFYPYFDVVQTDWPAARAAALRTAATDAGTGAFQATLGRLIAALHDGHGFVSPALRVVAAPDVQFGWADGRIFVTAVGDSAAANGVRRGDELLAVDRRRPDSLLAEASTRISGATKQWVRTRALAALLAGDFGTSVRARLRGADGTVREVSLARASLPASTDGRPDKIADLAPGVIYVDLGRITDADFAAALPRLEQARGIVFDMRGYPSRVNTPSILAHLTDTVIHSAHFEVPIITMPDHRDVGYVDGDWTVPPAAPRLRAQIAFLSGGGAISYAESTLGVVEAYRLGEIVGEPSAGTNGNVNPFVLPGGFNVVWTGMLVQKRDGTPHHGVGIVPTVPVSPTVAGLRAGRDEVLERATALVTPRPATP